jgi:predicted nuclease of predicted toxin-antitoxin system
MRFLADENFPLPVIDRLRLEGHDVLWVGAEFSSTSDKQVLELAEATGRILLTLDQDFWQIAQQRRGRLKRSGVILVRVHPATAKRVGELLERALHVEQRLIGRIALVTQEGVDLLDAGRKAET